MRKELLELLKDVSLFLEIKVEYNPDDCEAQDLLARVNEQIRVANNG